MYYWHLYGTSSKYYLFGPSAADPTLAASFAGILGMAYVTSWDHQPTPPQVDAALT